MSETNSNTKKSNRGLKNRHAFSSSLDKELYKKNFKPILKNQKFLLASSSITL
jgi:hypothetical protein